MLISNLIRVQLLEAQTSFKSGYPRQALERLNSLLARLDENSVGYNYDAAAVLAHTAIPLRALGDNESAELNLKQAKRLIESRGRRIGLARNELFIELAESLWSIEYKEDSLYFCDLVVAEIAHHIDEVCLDDIVEIMRRYGTIAAKANLFSHAQLTYLLGLVMMQEINGIESAIARDAVRLTSAMPLSAVPPSLRIIAEKLLGSLQGEQFDEPAPSERKELKTAKL